jgi:hypothetical protein
VSAATPNGRAHNRVGNGHYLPASSCLATKLPLCGWETIADDDSVDGKDTKIENKKGNQRSYLLFTLEILLITFEATDCFFAAVALVLEFARSDGGVLF